MAWEVGFGEAGTPDSNLSWERCYTEHELYLTWKQAPPQETEVTFYETVLHIGCTNANGKSDDQQIVSSIWNEFTDCSVIRKGGLDPMTYWGSAAFDSTYSRQQGTRQLLRLNGGRCGDWAPFFCDLLAVHGIALQKKVIYIQYESVGFLVKNWKFESEGTSGNSIFPFLQTEYTKCYGIPGQGNDNPKAYFTNHALVWSPNMKTLFDPSYGSLIETSDSIEYAIRCYQINSFSGFYQGNDVTHNMATNDVNSFSLMQITY